MDKQQFQRLQDLFEEGKDASAEARAVILQRCIGDPEVHRELQRMFASADVAPDFLETRPNTPDYQPTATSDGADVAFGKLHIGELVRDRFLIEGVVGAGGMGVVYKANDTLLHRPIALKVVSQASELDENSEARLQMEATAISALDHPNICRLYDYWTAGNSAYLAMEYIPGESLSERLRRGPLSMDEAVQVTERVCAALDHAHSNGVIHRDLKPGNIILGSKGVRLVDFGIALHHSPERDLDDSHVRQGTPIYMSPEQARGEKVDARSDIYSMGACLLEMITGSRHFGDDRYPETLASVPSRAIRSVIAKCLQSEPARRYASAQELQSDLQQILQAKAKARQSRILWLSLAGASTLFGLAFWFLNRPAPVPKVTALPPGTGVSWDPDLSRDGRRVVFLHIDSMFKESDIYTLEIGSQQPKQITNTPGVEERRPKWSPDGKWIAFVRGSSVYVVPAEGGAEQQVGSIQQRSPQPCGSMVTWADSEHLLYSASDRNVGQTDLELVDIRTGIKKPLILSPKPGQHNWCPSVSPDGKRLLYYSKEPDSSNWKTRTARLGPAFAVTEDQELPWQGGMLHAWPPAGDALLYQEQAATGSLLYRRALSADAKAEPLPFGEEAFYATASLYANRLVYMKRTFATQTREAFLSNIEIPPGVWSEAAARMHSSGAQLSRDGTRVAFFSNKPSSYGLWLAAADGTGLKSLLTPRKPEKMFSGFITDWSPDGKELVVSLGDDILTINANNGSTKVLVGRPEREIWPSYSRDGAWVYFTSFRKGEPRIWKVPSSGGEPVLVTQEAYLGAVEAYDGSGLFLLRSAGSKGSLSYQKFGSDKPVVIRDYPFPTAGNFGVIENGLLYIDAETHASRAGLWEFNLKTQRSRKIRDLDIPTRVLRPGLGISPDGQRVLYSAIELGGDLMLVDNFH